MYMGLTMGLRAIPYGCGLDKQQAAAAAAAAGAAAMLLRLGGWGHCIMHLGLGGLVHHAVIAASHLQNGLAPW